MKYWKIIKNGKAASLKDDFNNKTVIKTTFKESTHSITLEYGDN